MNIDERIAAEIDAIVEGSFNVPEPKWHTVVRWLERGRPGLLPEDAMAERAESAHMPASEQLLPPMAVDSTDYSKVEIRAGHMRDIPIIGTIDSATGAITHTAPLPEPPAPPPAQYAAGRMPLGAWIVGALSIAAAVAIAAGMVLVERVRGGRS